MIFRPGFLPITIFLSGLVVFVTCGLVVQDNGQEQLRLRRELDAEESESEELRSESLTYQNRDFCIKGTNSLIQVTSSEPIIQLIRAGSTITLRCTNSDEGLPVVPGRARWTAQNGELSTGRMQDDGQGVLRISNIETGDTGTYTCTITDGTTVTNTEQVLLLVQDLGGTGSFSEGGQSPSPSQSHSQPEVNDPHGNRHQQQHHEDSSSSSSGDKPQVTISPSYLQVKEGDAVQFQCTAIAYPPVESLAWRGGRSGVLEPHVQVENGIFRIPSVRKSDESEYHCDATNSLGTTSVRTILYVSEAARREESEAPRTTSRPYHHPSGSSSHAQEEQDSGRIVYIPEEDRPVITLRPQYPQRPQVQPVYVPPAQPGPTQPTLAVRVEPERQSVPQGSPIEIRCITYNAQNPTISWSKVGANSSLPSDVDTRTELLRIPSAQMTDRGVYVCNVDSSNGRSLASALVEVERREAPEIEIYPSTQQTIIQDGSALFQCRVRAGIPNPRVTWTRIPADENDRNPAATRIPSNVEEIQGGVLRFNRVTGEEQGQYLCTAESVAGRVTATASLRIQIFPVVTITPGTPHRVTTGERVKLECQASGDPLPKINWKKLSPGQLEGVEIQTRAVQVSETVISSAYEINRVGEENEGSYSCYAENEAGIDEQRIQLLVDEPVELTPTRLSSQEEQQQNRPTQHPYWPFNRPQIQPPQSPSHLSHSGNYGRDRQEEERRREDRVEEQTTTPAPLIPLTRDLTAIEGSRAVLRCSAQSSRGSRITWKKNGGSLPSKAVPIGNTLNIMFLDSSDQGRYTCLTDGGADYVDLTVVPQNQDQQEPEVSPAGRPEDPRNNAQGMQCQAGERKCITGNQCIPSSQFCDSEIDCLDGSDEFYCGAYRG